MDKTQDKTPGATSKRGRGRPAVIDGDVVNVHLRISALDRETLRQVGGAPWLRAQLAAARDSAKKIQKGLHE